MTRFCMSGIFEAVSLEKVVIRHLALPDETRRFSQVCTIPEASPCQGRWVGYNLKCNTPPKNRDNMQTKV